VNLIPKYSGCGPGGMNSSLMLSNKTKEFKEDLSIQQQSFTIGTESFDRISSKPLVLNK